MTLIELLFFVANVGFALGMAIPAFKQVGIIAGIAVFVLAFLFAIAFWTTLGWIAEKIHRYRRRNRTD